MAGSPQAGSAEATGPHATRLVGRSLLAVLALFSLTAAFTLSPYNSSYIPGAPDLAPAFGLAAQAEMGLKEGQFPLRVAPWEMNGWRYPEFQFYAPLPYTVFGLTAILLPGISLWLAIKWVFFLTLIVAAWGMYRLSVELSAARSAAVIAACAYVTAPYLLVNLHSRGAIPEAFSQCLLPGGAFLLLRAFRRRLLTDIIAAGVTLLAIFLSHTATALYFVLAVSLITFGMSVSSKPVWRSLVILVLAIVVCAGLGAYFFAPIARNRELVVSQLISNPIGFNSLTTLLELLSPTSVPPIPGGVESCPGLNAAIGLPFLLGISLLAYRCGLKGSSRDNKRFGLVLLSTIGIFFFLVWSPIDFWTYLPKEFYVIQFSYRNLAQLQWLCALALALGLSPWIREVFDRNPLPIIGGIAVCVLASAPYLIVNGHKSDPAALLKAPSIGYGSGDYLEKFASPERVVYFDGFEVPAAYSDGWTWIDKEFTLSRTALLAAPTAHLRFSGEVALVNPPVQVTLASGQQNLASIKLADRVFEWNIPVANILSANAGASDAIPLRFVPSQFAMPESPVGRKLIFRHRSLSLHGFAGSGTPVSIIEKQCHNYGTRTHCEIDMGSTSGVAQLPVIYYSHFLRVAVNGVVRSYEKRETVDPRTFHRVNLTAVSLGPGVSVVDAEFVGSRVGNSISAVFAGLLAIALLGEWFRKKRGLKSIQLL